MNNNFIGCLNRKTTGCVRLQLYAPFIQSNIFFVCFIINTKLDTVQEHHASRKKNIKFML